MAMSEQKPKSPQSPPPRRPEGTLAGGVQSRWAWERGDGRGAKGKATRKIARAEPFRMRVAGFQRFSDGLPYLCMAPLEGFTAALPWFPDMRRTASGKNKLTFLKQSTASRL